MISRLLGELAPLALVIALSPLSIIPAVLVLHGPQPRARGLAFLSGWLVGLTALTAAAIGASGLLGGLHEEPPAWASWVRIGVGAALIAFGLFRWFTRHRRPHQLPGLRHLNDSSPLRLAGIGALLTVANVKVLFICAAAGLAIGSAGPDIDIVVAAAAFVAVASSTVAVPILGYALSGKRLDPSLTLLRERMERHSAALVAVILIVIGAMLLYKGLHGR
ncbi:MAG TPA: GAP family protein [Mycolicibacterium fallax]|nr:GAP family protein [Mycolicibacterium fallax]